MTKRGMPKPFAILIAVLMALYFVPLGALSAHAATTGFEIDGNQVNNGAEDWKDLPAPTDGVATDLPDTADKTNRVLTTFLDNTVGGQDSTYAGANNKENAGSQWPNWTFTDTGNVAGKSDYGRLAAYSYVSQVGGVDHVFLNLGFDRGSNKGGTATDNYYFELNQLPQDNPNNINPKRTTGDIRITINDQGSSVFDPPVVQMWTATSATTGSWGPVTGNNPSYSIAANSSAPISDLASWWVSSNTNGVTHTIDTEGFLEASLDLTSFGAVLGCPSTGFSTLNGRSSTGASDKNLEDYFKASPIHIPSSCANLVINKVDGNGDPLGGATFSITPNPLPVGTPGRPAGGTVTIVDDSNANTTLDGGNYDDPDAIAGQITLAAVVPNVDYTITETIPPLGYIGTSAAQPPVRPVPFSEDNQITFTNDLGKAQWEKVDATSKTDICCATFRVQGTGGAAKTLGYDETVKDDNDNNTTPEGSTTVDDKNDAAGLIRLNNLFTGTYTVTEIAAPDGYDLPASVNKTFTITDTTLNTALTGTGSNTLTAGAFQDPRKAPDVSAIKHDTSSTGATLSGAQFTLYLDNGTIKGSLDAGDTVVPNGTHGDNPATTGANGLVTWTDLVWGDYLIVETAAPTGYTLPVPNPVQAFTVNRDNAGDNSRVFNFNDPRNPTTITVTKTDEDGKTVLTAPAQFGLYADLDHDGQLDAGEPLVNPTTESNPQWTTVDGTQNATVDGTVSWSNLDFGYYVVHELIAPQGYNLPANPDVAFHVTADNAGGTLTGTKADPKTTTHLTVLKTDEAGLPLAGATFQLWQETNSTTGLQTTGTADTQLGFCVTLADGTCTLPKVGDNFQVTWPNTYYWVETVPPSGYSLPDVADRVQKVDVTQANISTPFPATQFKDPKPAIVTHADSADLPDGTVTDYADLSGVADDATGTLHFALYGPFSDNTLKGDSCVDTSKLIGSVADVSINGPGRYPTGQGVVTRTVTKQGVYYWYVSYDSANSSNLFGSAVSKCGAANEVVTVNPATPKITTHATPSATYLAGTIHDAVTVRPVTLDASGDLVVSLYGPIQSSVADCTGTAAQTWTATRSADDSPGALEYTTTLVNGKYQIDWTTPEFTPTGAGNYFWKATYAGDANNLAAPAQGSNCGEISETSHEISHVAKAPTSITTAATANSLITPDGTDAISDEVRVHYGAAGVRPTGDVTLTLYGPLTGADPATSCATTPQAHQWTLHPGDGSVGTDQQGKYVSLTSTGFTPTAAGTYRWATSYEGDDNYLPADGACPDPNEVTRVSKPELDKSSDPATVASTADGTPTLVPLGSTITYTLTVTNTGDAPIVDKPLIDTLPDEVTFGHVTGATPIPSQSIDGGGHATLTWSVTLAAGASETFTYTVTVNQDAAGGDLLVNVARFLGLEDQTTHKVGVPVPTLEKTSPTNGQLVHIGDTIHYQIVVGNTGNFPITSSPLVDTLPDGVTFTSGTATTASTGGGSVDSGPVSGTDADGHHTLTWLITLPAGSTATVQFDALVTGAVPADTHLVNTATFEQLVSTTDHHTGHPTPTLDKSSPNEGATVPLGATIHYKVAVGNTGAYPITDSPVVDTLPDGVTYVAGSSAIPVVHGGGTASAAPTTGTSGSHNTLTWTVTLPPGADATFEFDVTVNADNPRGAELRNTAAFENLTDQTVHFVGIPSPTLDKFANPATTDASPTIVQPGTQINYSVQVGNTGNFPITDAPVVDTLPSNVSVVTGTISDGGTLSGDGKSITWTVTLAPGDNKTLTYAVKVDQAAPAGAFLVNTAKFQNLTDTTTHVVPTGALTLVKTVSPVAGHGVVVNFGDKLTYTLTASATGQLDQTDAVVRDTLPGMDPAHPKSGDVTYVAASAKCIGAGTCTVTGPDASGLITWHLGAMAAGTSRQVTFQVIIKDVTGPAGGTVAEDIINQGTVQSARTPVTPSNVVVTPVSKVLPVKVGPKELPHTGAFLPVAPTVGGGILLLGLGVLLVAITRRRRELLG